MTETNEIVQGKKEIHIPAIILDAMQDLRRSLPDTYGLLAARVESGYFEKNQSRNSINDLADRLLESLDKEASDED